MAKKFVRGITDIKTINNQDFDTNNVNDLLSDGEHNYIHRKKGKTEEYHNLTNNLKTITSDNTDLLTVTNDNETSNSATLHSKHDSQKEQAIASTRNTITINHAENGTSETTKVDTNPSIVLEHENLIAGDNLTKTHSGDTTTLKIADNFTQRVTSTENNITDLQNNKQNTLSSNTSIGVKSNNSLTQLFYYNKAYDNSDGLLKTNIKNIAASANLDKMLDEYTFIVKLNKGVNSISFELNYADTVHFNKIITMYGNNNAVRISGCDFNLSESTLTVSTSDNTQQNYVITFSHIV